MYRNKFYIAVELGNERVKYIYLSKHHIFEKTITLPPEIDLQFRHAAMLMMNAGTKVWIDEKFKEKTEVAM